MALTTHLGTVPTPDMTYNLAYKYKCQVGCQYHWPPNTWPNKKPFKHNSVPSFFLFAKCVRLSLPGSFRIWVATMVGRRDASRGK